jgi:hypothetical protein
MKASWIPAKRRCASRSLLEFTLGSKGLPTLSTPGFLVPSFRRSAFRGHRGARNQFLPSRALLPQDKFTSPYGYFFGPTEALQPFDSSSNARFNGRSIYVIVIPMEHMPAYGGDWIMWFADRQSKPGETPLVRAPVPLRKLEVVDQTPPSGRTGTRIQLSATLRKNGRLDDLALLTETSPAVQRAVFQRCKLVGVSASHFRWRSRRRGCGFGDSV